jgi:type II secretion system protein N
MSSILENRPALILFCVSYALILAFFLGYYLFPYDKLVAYLLDSHRHETGVEVQVAKVKPKVTPVTLVSHGVAFLGRGRFREKPLAHVSQITIKPSLLWVLGIRGTDLTLSADAYGGKVAGRIQSTGDSNPLKLDITLNSLDLALWKEVPALWGITMAGRLDGDLNFSGNPRRWSNSGIGKAVIKVTEGTVEGLQGLFIPINRLERCTLDTVLNISDSRVNVTRCRLNCSQGGADIAGLVALATKWPESDLNLTLRVSLNPQASKACGLPFEQLEMRLKGTLENPKVEFPSPLSSFR